MSAFVKSVNVNIVMGLLLTAVACSTLEPPVGKATVSLYERLGGKSALTAVVDKFVGNVAQDTCINGRFANTDIPQLKVHLVDQVCAATGGPCTFTGRDMKTTHAGMRISNTEFAALVEDLISAFNKFNVPEKEQSDLLGLLGPMKSDIVEIS